MVVFPDIYGRDFWRQPAQEYAGKEHIIFLGDYPDPYRDEEILPSKAFRGLRDILKLKIVHPDDVTLLLGNHDLHYLNRDMQGSRYDVFNAVRFSRCLEENAGSFHMAFEAGICGTKYLFTNAGVLPGWLKAHEFLFGQVEPDIFVTFVNSVWSSIEIVLVRL